MNLNKIVGNLIYLMTVLSVLSALLFPSLKGFLWDLSLYSVFLLMIIRPIADIFNIVFFRKLIVFRKHLGIFSSSIVVVYGLIHYYNLGLNGFLSEYFSLAYWTFSNNLFWAHMGELTGFILLITSNRFSMRLLKRNWKRIQKLSYLYFFSGAWYVFSSFDKTFGIIAIIIVFELTIIAYIKKRIVFNQETGDISWRW